MENPLEVFLLELNAIKDKQSLLAAYAKIEQDFHKKAISNEYYSKFFVKTAKLILDEPWSNLLKDDEKASITSSALTLASSSVQIVESIVELLDNFKQISSSLNYQKKISYKSRSWIIMQFILFEKIHLQLSVSEALELESSLANQMIDILFRLPTQICNYLEESPSEFKDSDYFRTIFNEVESSLTRKAISKRNSDYISNVLYLINKAIMLGKREYFVEFLVSVVYRDKDHILTEVVSDAFLRFQNNSKLFGSLVLAGNRVNMDCLLNKIVAKIGETDFVQLISTASTHEKSFNCGSAKIFDNLLKIKKISNDGLKLLLQNLVAYWYEVNYWQNYPINHQKFLSNLLTFLINLCPQEFMHDAQIVTFINDGIFNRMSHSSTKAGVVIQSAELVWSTLIKKMGIPGAEEEIRNENIHTKLFEDDPQEQTQPSKISPEEFAATNVVGTQKNEKIHPKGQDSDDDDEEFKEMIIPEEEYNPENYIRVLQPKYLYDCLLGLSSDSRDRVEKSLKFVNYLIRKKISDLELMADDFALYLSKLGNTYDMEKFEEYKDRALVSLIIAFPEQVCSKLVDRFYYGECSLGEKLGLLSVFQRAVEELADNPKKFLPEKYNEYTQPSSLTIKPVQTKKYTEEEVRKQAIEQEKRQKIEKNTRTWGYLRKKEQESRNLKPIARKDLIIIKNDDSNIFINRFNLLCDHFLFTLLIPVNKIDRMLRKETILLSKMVNTLTTFLENGKNSVKYYRMLEEVLDFLLAYSNINNVLFQKEKHRCLYLGIKQINRQVIMSYPILMDKIMKWAEVLSTQMDADGEQFRPLKYEILNSINGLFSIKLEELL